jgi:hypothetical protein
VYFKTVHLIKRREEDDEEEAEEEEVFAGAFEREQKRARSRTDEHGPIDRSARTNGKRFVNQNCVTAESWLLDL